MEHVRTNTPPYQVRTETYMGRKHLVAPVVLMVEGVHCGSGGPTLYTAEELSKFPEAWNGRPVPVFHPQENGIPVSCNDPQVIQRQSVGQLFNVHFDSDAGKLRGEIWVDEERGRLISPATMTALRNGRQLEVSTGLYTEDEDMPGVWNGEEYARIARNHRPDHLALLPGERGACSWEDGCGVRANEQEEGGGSSVKRTKLPAKVKEAVEANSRKLKDLINEGLIVDVNQGYREVMQKIQSQLDAMDTETQIHFLEELYDNSFIYRISDYSNDTTNLYKRPYSVGEDGIVSFGDETTQMSKRVEYVEVSTQNIEINQQEGEQDMDKKELVDGLISNKATKFEEEDRESLMALSECMLNKLAPVESAEPETNKEKRNDSTMEGVQKEKEEPKANSGTSAQNVEEGGRDLKNYSYDEFLQIVPPEIREQMEEGQRLRKAKHAELVKSITSNSDVYTKDELAEMKMEQLEKLAKLAKPKANYYGMGGAFESNASVEANAVDEDILLPPECYADSK